jgi:histidinol phosphatase-like PHP family hydrolase
VPKIKFVKMAKKAGAKFTFGTDSRSERAGKFEYCFQMAKRCGLTKKDMFVLKPDGKKAIQRETWDSPTATYKWLGPPTEKQVSLNRG